MEPKFFIPILPTLLLNGTRGIGERERERDREIEIERERERERGSS